jgi:hypothetical protein
MVVKVKEPQDDEFRFARRPRCSPIPPRRLSHRRQALIDPMHSLAYETVQPDRGACWHR